MWHLISFFLAPTVGLGGFPEHKMENGWGMLVNLLCTDCDSRMPVLISITELLTHRIWNICSLEYDITYGYHPKLR